MTQQIIDPVETGEARPLTGAGLLGVVTTGMYDNPLSMYREYIQNAADAIAGLEDPAEGRVEIATDIPGRRVIIRDNGPGLSHEDALDRLLPIGRSTKRPGTDRGFRGVGRLAGLAFAQTVTFTTRACLDQSLTRITWHSNQLPDLTSSTTDLQLAIRDCVAIDRPSGAGHPEHFFEVEIGGVALHSVGLLLNRDVVREYIGEVCPVPMSAGFPFAEELEDMFGQAHKPLELNIFFEGDSRRVERLYRNSVRLSANREAEFTEIEPIRIRADGNDEAAVGWVAHSPYLGAIPKDQRIRGIRARVGNIQIGGEAVFDHLFTEERLNRWCVGELHILDPRIVPNARRDYFQPGPHLRNLENQLQPILRKVAGRCRAASRARNRDQKTSTLISGIEDTYDLAVSGYVGKDYASALVRQALEQIPAVREKALLSSIGNGSVERLDIVQAKLNDFNGEPNGRPFNDMPASDVNAYQRMFQILVDVSSSPSAAKELMADIMLRTADSKHNGAEDE